MPECPGMTSVEGSPLSVWGEAGSLGMDSDICPDLTLLSLPAPGLWGDEVIR